MEWFSNWWETTWLLTSQLGFEPRFMIFVWHNFSLSFICLTRLKAFVLVLIVIRFSTFLNKCRGMILHFTPGCDLDHGFGNISSICDRFSQYAKSSCEVWWYSLLRFTILHKNMFWLLIHSNILVLGLGNINPVCHTPSHYSLSFCEFHQIAL